MCVRLKNFCNLLFSMKQLHLNAEQLIYMLRSMLRTIDRTVPSACAAKIYLHVCESSCLETLYMEIDKLVHTLKKRQNFTVILEKIYYWLVKPR